MLIYAHLLVEKSSTWGINKITNSFAQKSLFFKLPILWSSNQYPSWLWLPFPSSFTAPHLQTMRSSHKKALSVHGAWPELPLNCCLCSYGFYPLSNLNVLPIKISLLLQGSECYQFLTGNNFFSFLFCLSLLKSLYKQGLISPIQKIYFCSNNKSLCLDTCDGIFTLLFARHLSKLYL